MDSFTNSTKTNLLHHQQSSPNPQRRDNQKPLIISLIVLIALIIAAIITATTTLIIRQSSPTEISIAKSIRVACSFAPYKRLCRTALSSAAAANNSDYPGEIIFASLQLAVTQLNRLSSLPRILISKPNNDPRTESTLLECQVLFDKEMSRLNDSVAAMKRSYTSRAEVNDIMSWFNAVGTHQQVCLDRLEENGSTVLDEVSSKVQDSRKFMSNTLAILANTDAIFDKIYDSPSQYYSDYDLRGLSWKYAIFYIAQYTFLLFLFCLMLKLY